MGPPHVSRDRARGRAPRRPRSTRWASSAGERVAIVSHNSARLSDVVLGRERLGPRPRADQLPSQRGGDRLHRRALRRASAAGRSRARGPARGRRREAAIRDRRRRPTDDLLPLRLRARAVDARRGRDRDHQLHERHDGAAQGRRADAPHDLVQRHDLRLAGGRVRPRRVPAHAADVPLQRLGHAVRRDRHGRHAHRAAQGRRRRDPAPRRPARRHPAVRRARRSSPRSSTPPRAGTARSRAAAARASSSPARRRRRARSSGSRPSSDGSSSRSTGSPRPRRCSR